MHSSPPQALSHHEPDAETKHRRHQHQQDGAQRVPAAALAALGRSEVVPAPCRRPQVIVAAQALDALVDAVGVFFCRLLLLPIPSAARVAVAFFSEQPLSLFYSIISHRYATAN